MKLQFLTDAELEFLEAIDRYEDEALGLGDRFRLEVRHTLDLLLDNPHLGTPLENRENVRYTIVRRFPYIIFYVFELENCLTVLAVAHSSRRPYYWKPRMDSP